MKKIKLIWEFSGNEAIKIAEHHLIHLNEYTSKENIDIIDQGTESLSKYRSLTYIITYENFLEKIRIDLKPNKGYLVNK